MNFIRVEYSSFNGWGGGGGVDEGWGEDSTEENASKNKVGEKLMIRDDKRKIYDL